MSGPTREQVIQWAHESGDDVEHTLPSDIDFLERFASVAFSSGQASEREACVQVIKDIAVYGKVFRRIGEIRTPAMNALHLAIDFIRARGQQ